MKKNIITSLCIILWCCATTASVAQTKYWISFEGKSETQDQTALVSPKTLANRQMLGLAPSQYSDLPVDPSYTQTVKQLGAKVLIESKWLNAISVIATDEVLTQIEQLAFVTEISPVRTLLPAASQVTSSDTTFSYSTALKQINGEAMVSNQITAKGVDIGIIDAGFFRADKDFMLKSHFEQNRVKAHKDYVTPLKAPSDFFDDLPTNSTHGTTVMRGVGGVSSKYLSGLASEANYYLARTDDDYTEYLIEEDYWVAAMEWMDSLGVRLINTSLGYGLGHTNPEDNYEVSEMNGKHAKISIAAEMAVTEKGIIVVNSAGNEGDDRRWVIISAPSDAPSVISVGATNTNGMKMGYSSVGPDFLDYVKPDVSCYSLNGTSFSAPVITGLVACLLQVDSTLTTTRVTETLHKASNLHSNPNTFIGYGVPDCEVAYKLVTGQIKENRSIKYQEVKANGTEYEIKFKKKSKKNRAILFHKSNATVVINQERSSVSGKRKLTITRPENAKRTTVIVSDTVYELLWKD